MSGKAYIGALFGVVSSLLFAGCAALTTGESTVISPSQNDWESAYAELNTEQRSAIAAGIKVTSIKDGMLDPNVYQFRYGPPGGKPIGSLRLIWKDIISGYDTHFAQNPTASWSIIKDTTFFTWGPSGDSRIFAPKFYDGCKLVCLLKNNATGEVQKTEVFGSARAASTEKGADGLKRDTGCNRALALAFLRTIAEVGDRSPQQ